MHAATCAGAIDPPGREALLRYVLRPPIAQERVELRPDARTSSSALPACAVQALNADGTLVEDSSIGEGPHALHVRNAPSPAATASLAFGREIADLAIARFGLG